MLRHLASSSAGSNCERFALGDCKNLRKDGDFVDGRRPQKGRRLINIGCGYLSVYPHLREHVANNETPSPYHAPPAPPPCTPSSSDHPLRRYPFATFLRYPPENSRETSPFNGADVTYYFSSNSNFSIGFAVYFGFALCLISRLLRWCEEAAIGDQSWAK